MQPYLSPQRAMAGTLATGRVEARLAFLRRVYSLLTLTVVAAAAGAMASLYLGTDSSTLTVAGAEGTVVVPPLVAFFANHWIIGGLVFLGSVMVASVARRKRGVNVVALLAMGTVSGLVAAPAIWVAQFAASQGHTLTTQPVRDAFLLAVVAFVGLTSYALLSKRDFSFLRGFVTVGLWVLIGATILSLFVHSSAFGLAIASAGVLLFAGFILYDTSRLLRVSDEDMDAPGAAISLFLSFLNLFLFLLRILSGGSRE